jgi:hypothetical protein
MRKKVISCALFQAPKQFQGVFLANFHPKCITVHKHFASALVKYKVNLITFPSSDGLKSSLYHLKDLGTSMFQMDSHDPFGHLKHKL